jgi:hypothetical protein
MEEIFKLNKNGNVIGYIGGKPAEELDIEKLCKLYSINFELAENYNPNADYFNENVVFVDNLNIQPTDLDITFNTQLYYYKNGIRTGESSGSAHTSASVPVVLEMNDAENVENLKVIKIPYGSKDDIESIDFASGARSISELIQSGEYKEWLDHNFEQSRKINNTFIAGEYIKLFKTLVSYK